MVVYDDERSIRERSSATTAKDTASSNSHSEVLLTPAITTARQPATVTAVDPVAELAEQISRLSLVIQTNMQGNPPVTSVNTASTPSVMFGKGGMKDLSHWRQL